MTHRLAAVAAILALGMAAAAQSISIQRDGNTFKVAGWTAPSAPPAGGWPSVLVVYAGTGDVPPLAGAYSVEHGVLAFRSAYPVSAGVRYRAMFHPPGRGAAIEQTFDGPPRSSTPLTRVDRVVPSAAVLPSNQLRLYIYFSAPMSRGEAARRIHLLDGKGRVLTGIFLPGEELWDPTDERLTMTFDPGRIKRGLTSNEKMGPPIVDGERYELVIDRGWPDARGVPLVDGFRKAFEGGPAVRTPPDPKAWRIAPPAAGTSAPLVVDFPRPMNYVLLQRMLRVSAATGDVAGVATIGRDEAEWRFTPSQAWRPGAYRLIVDTGLEDLAGNRMGQLFDIDVFERVTEHITTQTIEVPFAVRSRTP